ncbi:MAG: hypothetical protein IJA30_00080 [Bacilli bacterium]|nr:hypothetical protein [Bacilli bacterium]
MFGYGDRITLSLVNGADINGKAVPFNLRLPAAEDYEIPEDLSVVDVFEYQEGSSTNGLIVFSIYVGNKKTIGELADINDGKHIKLREQIEIPSIDSDICYQTIGDNRFVYAVVEDNDLVVNSHEELRDAISKLSEDFNNFNKSVQKIKCFGKNINR